ncbi:MAG: hypothetical protein ACM31E_08480, partial [Fibrobacterota bacterium]|nr:hypothetical protein [Chitinispirillaceae bacterium]
MKRIRQSNGYTWRFFRAGGFDQVRLDSAQDLLELKNLDQKLWVALACPIDNIHFDKRTLKLIDSDGDNRIRPAELIAAINWTIPLLKNPEDAIKGLSDFSLESINDSTAEGKQLFDAMKRTLAALGKGEQEHLSIEDLESLEKTLSEKPFNGDGIITEDNATDDPSRKVISEILASQEPLTDRSGKPGINKEKIDTFFSQAEAFLSWYEALQKDPSLCPSGDKTQDAAQALSAVEAKINDFFTRCAIASFDQKATAFLNGGEKQYEQIGTMKLSLNSSDIAELPLSAISPKMPLHFGDNINPAWSEKIQQFRELVVNPILGADKKSITESEWLQLCTTFAPWNTWQQKKPTSIFDATSIDHLKVLLSSTIRKQLTDLIDKDNLETSTFASLINLEKLARFRRDLHSLCVNFVNFKDFYTKGDSAVFQAGTLYLDQRSCKLCIRVDDPNKHAGMAAMAGTFLVYCECKRPGGAKMTIVAAFTNGDSENLIVGRNGVFYDRSGLDWDATIIKIIENPISLRQAFWLPYKNLVRMIETQVAKRATTAAAQSTAKLEKVAVTTANVDATKPPAPPPKKLDIGIVAALGVAAGALGTFIATGLGFLSGIIKLGPFAILGALAGMLLLISGPSLILAYIKLRKRNLGPILDASGWAIN